MSRVTTRMGWLFLGAYVARIALWQLSCVIWGGVAGIAIVMAVEAFCQ